MRISWDDYLALRRARLADVGETVDVLPGWSCSTVAGLERARPGPVARAAALGPEDALPRRKLRATAARHDAWLESRPLPARVPDSPVARRRWAQVRLLALGERLPGEGRRSWTEGWRAESAEDGVAAGVLVGLSTGSWTVRPAAEGLLLRPVLRSFRGVCLARRLPPPVRARALDDLREAVFYRLSLPDDRGTPGWVELAARTLETAGPLSALVAPLGEDQRRRAAVCAATRGRWADSARRLLEGRGRLSRAQVLLRRLHNLEGLLDSHLQLRLLDRWAGGATDPDGDWRQVVQSRARARARLRALAGERPNALLHAVVALPALAARLRDAAARWAWAWAWEELARDFAFDLGRPVVPPCDQEDLLPPSWPTAWEAPLQTWLLLVVLRDRRGHLERWAATGSTGDRDSTWGRLLSAALPPDIAEGGLSALQLELQQSLGRRLEALVPLLRLVAGLRPGRGRKAAFLAALGPHWSEAVPVPRSGFPSMQAAALRALASLSSPRTVPP